MALNHLTVPPLTPQTVTSMTEKTDPGVTWRSKLVVPVGILITECSGLVAYDAMMTWP
jgi:hypothetical protein